MARYSKNSSDKLSSCHIDLQRIFNEVIKHFDNTILCGERGEKEQTEAYEKGFSKVIYPNSKHNSSPSMAVDSVPYPISWENKDRMRFYIGFVLGIATMLKQEGKITHDLVSGIDWDGDTFLSDQLFIDLPHFQLK